MAKQKTKPEGAGGQSAVIEQIPTAELIPYIRNSRTHSEIQVQQIAGSIQEFGFCNPVLIDAQNGIIAGHGRVMAAQLLKLESVPCLRLSHLTDAQKRAYVIADNRLALSSGWDEEMLANELSNLHADEFDMALLGFDADELTALMDLNGDELPSEPSGEVVEDEVPEVPVDPITKPGNLWILGEHRLLCGDSESSADVLRLMKGEIASLIHTDPPYGVSFQSNMRTATPKFAVLENDDKILTDWIQPAIANSSGWVFVWTTWKVLDRWLQVVRPFGKLANMVVWHKGGGGMGDLTGAFATDYEIALVFNRGATLCGKRIGSVWAFSKDAAAKYEHPTQKPVALAAEAIEKTTVPKSLVMDLFLGSGTTLIAAEQLNRKCYGMEISPAYCDVIVKRWENLTGKTAVLESA
jgi:DNA modification methylase